MDIIKMKNIFTIPILSLIGLITNIFSIIVFSLIIKSGQRDDMYKHLLLKSICEALGCLFSVFYALYYSDESIRSNYIMVIWLIWFQNFIIKVFFMASTGFEIAATFSCAISIEKKMKWCQKRISFWLCVLFILILSFGVEVFKVLTNSVKKFSDIDKYNKTIHYYVPWPTSLYSKAHLFGLVESIIKEVIFLLILLLLNCYILFKLIQIGRRKKRLTTNSSNIQSSNRAQNRKIIMIIVLFLTFLLGHLPNVIYFAVNTNPYITKIFWTKFKIYGEILLYVSYSISFFVYFGNNIFRRLFLRIIWFRSVN
jgi:hypothetical protein